MRDRGFWRVGIAAVAVVILAAACAPFTGLDRSVNAPLQTATFRLGPFNLAAMDTPGFESMASASNIPRPAGAFGIQRMSFDVVDAGGVPVSKHDVHLHHVLLMNNSRQDILCPGRPERFAGSGSERTPITLLSNYAYLVGANNQWSALWHIMNETATAKSVYIQYTIGYDTTLTAGNTRAVTPYFQDVTGCGNSVFDVPGNGGPGSVYERSRTWTAPADGIAVYSGGHLHEGGIDNVLKGPNGEVACDSVVSYHENPRHVDKITPCFLHHFVEAGEQYTLTSRYDNSAPWQDVMGINLTYVWHGTPPSS